MSEEPTPDQPSQAEVDAYARERERHQPDTMLAVFVKMANESDDGIGQPVTLTIGGSLLSGKIVGRVKWIEDLIAHYGEPVQGLRAFRDLWVESNHDMASDELMAQYETIIHLEEARWYLDSTGSTLPSDGSFWRGRLSEIQGWTLGTLGTGEPDD